MVENHDCVAGGRTEHFSTVSSAATNIKTVLPSIAFQVLSFEGAAYCFERAHSVIFIHECLPSVHAQSGPT